MLEKQYFYFFSTNFIYCEIFDYVTVRYIQLPQPFNIYAIKAKTIYQVYSSSVSFGK